MTNKEIVEKFFIDGYQNNNYDFVLSVMADNYFDHSPAGARSNKDAVNILKIVEGMFSNLKITIIQLIAENDMVASHIKYEGVHTGECMGVSPTNKVICFEALENFRIKDGKIVESWGYWPDMDILHQLKD